MSNTARAAEPSVAAGVASGLPTTNFAPLSWIWYLLALYPEAEARLHAELDEVLGGRPITPDQVGKLVRSYVAEAIEREIAQWRSEHR